MTLFSGGSKNQNLESSSASKSKSPSKSKLRLSRRLILKGLAFSICFHAGLFLLFQVKSLTIANSISTPSTVYISPSDSFITIVSGKRSQDEDPRLKYAREFRLNTSCIQEPTHSLLPPELILAATSTDDYASIDPILPWDFTDECAPSHQKSKVYPIKITLHSSLRHLSFIDDAESLFIEATTQTLISTSICAPMGSKLSFNIEISPKTGKIQKIFCIKETFDNRLQTLADRILRKLQFYTQGSALKKNIWNGTISIQFYGSYDTISPLLTTEAPS